MLLDESKWRIDLIGDWSAPLIREETKWRYGLYKKWLRFLDEGLGDSFDVVLDGFEEADEEEEGRDSTKAQSSNDSSERLDNARAVKYERWLKSQLQDDEEWEEKALVERSERSRRREANFRPEDKEGWFDEADEETMPEQRRPPSRKTAREAKGRQPASKPKIDTLEDYDEL